jgi:ABC-2 type transport system ATP-binding protein
MGSPAIRTLGLTKWYGRHRGVLDLGLEVGSGEVFGYLGPNGAGKTTTIRLLLDLIRPTGGRAEVLGLDSHRDTIAIRRRVGYVPGELHLYDSLSGQELLAFFDNLRGGGSIDRGRELAGRLDCDLTREIRTLSHGNRRKLSLIQAFMSDPELLILDEPTQGLDPIVQQAFFALVAEARAAGRTVFFSSHVLPEIERVCDRVAVLRDGRLLAVERVADLKARTMRQLELVFGAPVPVEAFGSLSGVRDLEVEGDRLRCTVVGSVDPLLKVANRFEIVSVATQETPLEEIFLAYYGSEAPDAA